MTVNVTDSGTLFLRTKNSLADPNSIKKVAERLARLATEARAHKARLDKARGSCRLISV